MPKKATPAILSLLLVLLFNFLDAQPNSPFSAIQWQGQTPIVRVNNQWQLLRSANSIPTQTIITKAKEAAPLYWKAEFSYNFLQLCGIKETYRKTIPLSLSPVHKPEKTIERPNCAMTRQNTIQLWYQIEVLNQRTDRKHKKQQDPQFDWLTQRYFDESSGTKTPIARPGMQKFQERLKMSNSEIRHSLPARIPRKEAEEDLDQFEWLLEQKYAYLERREIDYRGALDAIRANLGQSISPEDFALQLQCVLGMFGDRHSRLKLPDSPVRLYDRDIQFPFSVLGHEGKWIAADLHKKSLLEPEFPYIRSLNGIAIDKWSQTAIRLQSGGSERQNIEITEKWMRKPDLLCKMLNIQPIDLPVVLTDHSGEKTKTLNLKYLTKEPPDPEDSRERKVYPNKIAYLPLKRMHKSSSFRKELHFWMKGLRKTEGMIIDMRGNMGGGRHLLTALVPYFLPPKSKPIIATAGAVRINPEDDPQLPNGLLEYRKLFPPGAPHWTPAESLAVDEFHRKFTPNWTLPPFKFGEFHYTCLSPHDATSEKYHYDKPVVVLIDHLNFSAAEIMISALQQCPNVTLLGVPTLGGSGRAETIRLFHSQLEFKISRMASFHPSGKLYEQNGIQPDVYHPYSLRDRTGETDSMLDHAFEIILSRE